MSVTIDTVVFDIVQSHGVRVTITHEAHTPKRLDDGSVVCIDCVLNVSNEQQRDIINEIMEEGAPIAHSVAVAPEHLTLWGQMFVRADPSVAAYNDDDELESVGVVITGVDSNIDGSIDVFNAAET